MKKMTLGILAPGVVRTSMKKILKELFKMLEEKSRVLFRLVQRQDGVRQEFMLFNRATIAKILGRAGKDTQKTSDTLQVSDHALNGHHPDVPGPVALVEKAVELHNDVEKAAIDNSKSNLKVYLRKENCILTFFCYKVVEKVYTALTTAYVPDRDKECDITV